MASVFMINIYVGNDRRQDWAQGELGLECSHKTSADNLRVVPIWGGKRLFLPAAFTSIWMQTVFEEDVTLGNEVFFRLGNF